MLERFFVMPKTVDRIMGCWLGPQIDQYVTVLCEQGYAARSIYRRVPILTSFADFTAARHVDQIDQAEALVDTFVANWLSARCGDRSTDARRRSRNFIGVTVRHFFSLVVSKSEYRCNRTVWADPFAVQVPGFFDYLRDERGLRPRSLLAYRHYLRRFERYLEDVGCELAALSLPVVTGYITTVAQQFGPRSMVNIAGTLRVFLRHAHREGLLQRDISKQVKVGEEVEIVGIRPTQKTVCTGVEMFRKLLDQGQAGDNIGVLLRGVKREEVERGQVVAKPGSITPHTKFKAEAYILTKEEGGRHTPFFDGYRPQFYFRTTDVTGVAKLPQGTEMVMPGDNVTMEVTLIQPIAMEKELRFAIREGGRTVGAGVVSEVLE